MLVESDTDSDSDVALLTDCDIDTASDFDTDTDRLWLFLNYLYKSIFGDLGFHTMLTGMAAFTCFVLYRFTIKYISPEYYALSIALLLLEPNNILVISSAMRQSIAVGIFLLNIDSLIEKRYVQYTAGILLASLFHSSALFFLVLILVELS